MPHAYFAIYYATAFAELPLYATRHAAFAALQPLDVFAPIADAAIFADFASAYFAAADCRCRHDTLIDAAAAAAISLPPLILRCLMPLILSPPPLLPPR